MISEWGELHTSNAVTCVVNGENQEESCALRGDDIPVSCFMRPFSSPWSSSRPCILSPAHFMRELWLMNIRLSFCVSVLHITDLIWSWFLRVVRKEIWWAWSSKNSHSKKIHLYFYPNSLRISWAYREKRRITKFSKSDRNSRVISKKIFFLPDHWL